MTIAPDVRPPVDEENADSDEEDENEESSETKVQALSQQVRYFSSIMERFLPLLERLDLQETSEKKKGKKPRAAETPKKYPWDRTRDPTFTEVAGSMAYSSKDSSPKDFKRRNTIFDQAEDIEDRAQAPSYRKTIPPFKGELKSTRLSDVTRFFKDLNAYQSEHNTSERGAPHLTWTVRSQLTPTGVSDEAFTQISNKELFALIRKENRPASQGEFRLFFVQDLIFFVKDNFELRASTYREWVAMVRVFFREVLLRYEFLAEGLDPRLIPNIEDRETGLVSLILSNMVPYDTAKKMHDEFFYDFKKKNRNYTLADWIEAYQQKTDSYIQFARDSMALETAIFPKASYPANSPVYAKKFEYAPKRFTENYSQHNTEERKSVLFVENGKDESYENNEFLVATHWPNMDVINPNIEEIDTGSHGSKDVENLEVENDREELLAFVSDTRPPLKPMSNWFLPRWGQTPRFFPLANDVPRKNIHAFVLCLMGNVHIWTIAIIRTTRKSARNITFR
jgi:hypothetical protein